MFCVTSVYLRDITSRIFFKFALECESSERLLFFLNICCELYLVYIIFDHIGIE